MKARIVNHLSDALRLHRGRHVVVVTGAGVSHASGIATFRGTDRDAVWKRDLTELGTLRYFQEDPVGSWRWYSSRFDRVRDRRPNSAHAALVSLEQWQREGGGEFTLVTQNVDTLHEIAGSRELLKVHGSADRVRCVRMGCEFGAPSGSIHRDSVDFSAFFEMPNLETLPKCPGCGSLLRQHVLWFDEYYDSHDTYEWSAVRAAAEGADLVLFVGTSFAVGVTDLFLQNVIHREVTAFSIDPAARQPPHRQVGHLPEKAEVLLPAVCASLGLSLCRDGAQAPQG